MIFTPLVSIIIPTYNRAKIILETLFAVQSQTYGNWECIIVDDESEDNSKLILENFIKTDKRFYYYKNQRSKGAPGARNTGLDFAKGEFVSFFDSDDRMLPTYIEGKLKYFLENNQLDLVISLSKWININKEMFYTNIPTTHHPLIRFYSLWPYADIPWFTPSLIRKSFLEDNNIKWDETMTAYQDIQFNVCMLSKDPAFFWIKDVCHWIWVCDNNINNTSKQNHNHLKITEKLLSVYWSNLKSTKINNTLKKKVLKQYHSQIVSFCGSFLQSKDDEKEFLKFIKSNSNFTSVDRFLLKNRIRFTNNLPNNMRERVFWKVIRIYFHVFYHPIINKGHYLNHTIDLLPA